MYKYISGYSKEPKEKRYRVDKLSFWEDKLIVGGDFRYKQWEE